MREQATSFERFEYKYLVPDRVAQELLAFVSPYMRCDDWARGGQRITNLYLDSPALDFMRGHTEAAPDRCKLRVRAYGDPPADPAFFEIKRKVKNVTFKDRAVVPLATMPALLRGEIDPSALGQTAAEQRMLEHFLYLMVAYRAEPKVVVTYIREAYTSAEPSDEVRLTLDRDICYQAARGYFLHGDPQAWAPLCGVGNYRPGAATLIELKFRGIAPWWINELVQQLRLTISSYSKYVMAMVVEELEVDGFSEWDLEPLAASPIRMGR